MENLTKKIAEYETKSKLDNVDSTVEALIDGVREVIVEEVKKAQDMGDILHRLANLKSILETMPQTNVQSFVVWIKKQAVFMDKCKAQIDLFKEYESSSSSMKSLQFNSNSTDLFANLVKEIGSKIEWYNLMKSIHDKLTDGGVAAFDDTLKSFKDKVDNQTINNFLDKLKLSRYYTPLTAEQITELNALLTGIDTSNIDTQLNRDENDTVFTFNANFIRLSAVLAKISEIGPSELKLVKIHASNSVYFDTDVIKTGVNFSIVAPKWVISKDIKVNLSGSNAEAYTTDKAESGTGCFNADGSGMNGKHGLPGKCGKSAGHFFGICGLQTSVEDLNRLTFILNGGSGANGQNGGDGGNGKEGINATTIYENSKDSTTTEGSSYNRTIMATDFGFTFCIKRDVKIFQKNGILFYNK